MTEHVSIPIMITRDARQRLQGLNYSDEDIDAMKPSEAWEILNRRELAQLAGLPLETVTLMSPELIARRLDQERAKANGNGHETEAATGDRTLTADNIPAAMLACPNWIGWRLDPPRKAGDKPAKVPIDPHTGKLASSTDPATWGTFEQAQSAVYRYDLAGIGFVFTGTPLCGVDLDHCRDPETGLIEPWALEVIGGLKTYTEVSPSGTGVHIMLKGDKPGPSDKQKSKSGKAHYRPGQIEIYDTGRYFTVTAHHVDSTPLGIEERQAELEALYHKVFGRPDPEPWSSPPNASAPASLDDRELLDLMLASSNGGEIQALLDGDISGYPSHSEADLALCNFLAFWTGKDATRMDRVFRTSGLYRQKWGRDDYRNSTIQAAIDGCAQVYTPFPSTQQPDQKRQGPIQAQPTSRPALSDQYVQRLRQLGYTFRLNKCTDDLEVNGEPISDVLEAEIRTRLRDAGFSKSLAAVRDAYTYEGSRSAYHPVLAYLDSLVFQGEGHIARLADHFVEKPHQVNGQAVYMFPLYLRRWCVGAVAKARTGKQNPMLVIDGAQGVGKSHLVAWLCPLRDLFVDSPIDPSNKDHDVNLISRWLWEVSELGATTRKADRESLKAFISREWVTIRKPYGHYPINKPALASFIGTINNEAGFLSDPTGSRRFNVCTIEAIDWGYSENVDVDAVWAEALHLYAAGEPWLLTTAEKEQAETVNREYAAPDAIEDLLLKYYDVTGDPNDFTPAVEVVQKLQDMGFKGTTKALQMELSATMRRLGIERSRHGTQRIRGYRGILPRNAIP